MRSLTTSMILYYMWRGLTVKPRAVPVDDGRQTVRPRSWK